MKSDEIIGRLSGKFGADKVKKLDAKGGLQAVAVVPKEILADVARFLRDDPELDCKFLATIAAFDYLAEEKKIKDEKGERTESLPAHLDVAYVFSSVSKNHRVNVKVVLDRERASVPSLTGLFPAADWHEREQYDLLGVTFEGHPDLRRLMLPDDWQGHPLRKDYQQAPEWRGIPTSRPNSHDLFRERLAAEKTGSS